MPFRDADDVTTYIGGIFEAAFEDPELADRLRATGVVLQMRFHEPAADVVVDLVNQSVHDSADGLAVGATLAMSAETGNAYWQGKVNLPLAMAKGQVKVDGKVAGLLKLAPLSKRLYPTYVARLQADGRHDLVV